MNIGEMQRLLSRKAEREPDHKFGDLHSLLCDPDWLWLAHDSVAQNAGSKTAGCDGITMKEFDHNLERNLQDLRSTLQSGTFVACPVRRVNIPKPNGKVRPLGIATIRDRIVQEAVRMVLEPIFEADFCQRSFGFRPNRRTMDAIKYLIWSATECKKFFWVVEGDISSYFDTIHHRRLVKFLRRRVQDGKLLRLLWQFLRAGVMERKLFKDTRLGVPQGGIVSPLLANVYLHQLDRYMERYTALDQAAKSRRRQQGLANYVYVRYADDFVVLCNGTREQAEALRQELHQFLATKLRLTLSLEKTKITHVNDGFDFLGFHLQRAMGGSGMGMKTTIAEKARRRHLEYLQVATALDTYEDSAVYKLLALNRAIAGWCRYFQYTSRAGEQFHEMEHIAFWRVAHWLARKAQLSMPETLRRYRRGSTLGVGPLELLRHSSFPARCYAERFFKPNPYTTQQIVEREELPATTLWTGHEARPGMGDLRPLVIERDGGRCCMCGEPVTPATCVVDHVRPVRFFKRPVEANYLENLWTLCIRCHQEKTELDRQRESRMQG
jgi:group II intron reverse transcriptase/maturase